MMRMFSDRQRRTIGAAFGRLFFVVLLLESHKPTHAAGFGSPSPVGSPSTDHLEAPFLTTWKTDNAGSSSANQVQLRIKGRNLAIAWGDRSIQLVDVVDGVVTHTYATAGTFQISIGGGLERMFFRPGDDNQKLISVDQWGTIEWQSMEDAFSGCNNLEVLAVDVPDLSNVSSAARMFASASTFNADLSAWDVSSVTDMRQMFLGASTFNQDLNTWDVSSVTDMSGMFLFTPQFNGDLSAWDVSSVEDMSAMFGIAQRFNQDLSAWDVSSVTTMTQMFTYASAFDQDLSAWDVSSVTTMQYMLDGTSLSTQHYDAALRAWSVQPVQNGVSLGAFAIEYSRLAQNARERLVNIFGWNIQDGGLFYYPALSLEHSEIDPVFVGMDSSIQITNTGGHIDTCTASGLPAGLDISVSGDSSACVIAGVPTGVSSSSSFTVYAINSYGTSSVEVPIESRAPFLSTWKTNSYSGATLDNQVRLRLEGENIRVAWGDGTAEVVESGGAVTHTYASEGTFQIAIGGGLGRMFFLPGDDNRKLLSVEQWGDIEWRSMEDAFNGCLSLTTLAPDAPDLTRVRSMARAFYSTRRLNADLSSWDVSSVTNMERTFDRAIFRNRIGVENWDVSSVTNMEGMFYSNKGFHQDLSAWDVSSVTNMARMFYGAGRVEGLSEWNVTSVTTMSDMLTSARLSHPTTSSYDSLLLTWSTQQGLQRNVELGAIGKQYSLLAEDARDRLINTFGWNIQDGGRLRDPVLHLEISRVGPIYSGLPSELRIVSIGGDIDACTADSLPAGFEVRVSQNRRACEIFGTLTGDASSSSISVRATNGFGTSTVEVPLEVRAAFVTTWKTDNQGTTDDNQVQLRLEGQRISIDWGDGSSEVVENGVTVVHTYSVRGEYAISIGGGLARMYFSLADDPKKLLSVDQWGDIEWQNMQDAFYGCSNMQVLASDAPDLSRVTSMMRMFAYASAFNSDLDDWDVSSVTDMSNMFVDAITFNGDISAWDVSSVTHTTGMFANAPSFNQDLSRWDVSSAQMMAGMFYRASAFDQDLSAWDVSSVTSMWFMLNSTALSTENYDALLNAWAAQDLQPNVSLGATGVTYSPRGRSGRDILTSVFGWSITDSGLSAGATTWPTANPWADDTSGGSDDEGVGDGTTPGAWLASMSNYVLSLAQAVTGYHPVTQPWPEHPAVSSRTNGAVDDVVIVVEDRGTFAVRESPAQSDLYKLF